MNLKKTNKPNEWLIDYYRSGKRTRQRVIGSKRMAEEAMIKIKARILEERAGLRFGLQRPKKKIKFEDYCKIYIENYSKEKKSLKNELYVINRLKSHFGDMYLHEISPGDIDRFKLKRKQDGLQGSTVNLELSRLRAILNRAIASEDYAINRNPCSKVEFFKANGHKERILTKDEIHRLLEASHNSWGGILPLFLTLALNTAGRKMELLSLKWENVDFKKKHIEITAARSKSGKSRHILMNDVVFDALAKAEKKGEYVFYNPQSRSYIKNLRDSFDRAKKKAEIGKDVTIHTLRHTAASILVNDCGISLATAAKILGHSDIKMTMRYVHVQEEHIQKGINRLGEIFKNSDGQKVDTAPKITQLEKPSFPLVSYN